MAMNSSSNKYRSGHIWHDGADQNQHGAIFTEGFVTGSKSHNVWKVHALHNSDNTNQRGSHQKGRGRTNSCHQSDNRNNLSIASIGFENSSMKGIKLPDSRCLEEICEKRGHVDNGVSDHGTYCNRGEGFNIQNVKMTMTNKAHENPTCYSGEFYENLQCGINSDVTSVDIYRTEDIEFSEEFVGDDESLITNISFVESEEILSFSETAADIDSDADSIHDVTIHSQENVAGLQMYDHSIIGLDTLGIRSPVEVFNPRCEDVAEIVSFKTLVKCADNWRSGSSFSSAHSAVVNDSTNWTPCPRLENYECLTLSDADGARLDSHPQGPSNTLNTDWMTTDQVEMDITHKKRNSEVENECIYNIDEVMNYKGKPGFIDTHCHLDFLYGRYHVAKDTPSLSDFQATYMSEQEIPPAYEGCVAIFCKPLDFHRVEWWTKIIHSDHTTWAAFGCHPHFCHDYDTSAHLHLEKALSSRRTVALGEVGLDYSYKNTNCPELQKKVLQQQLELAARLKIPVVIHCRDAADDCLAIMKQMLSKKHKIHRHCFTGNLKEALRWMESFENLYFGFTPMITCDSHQARQLCDVAKQVPLERMLLETDAPYFRPRCLQNNRSDRNAHPGMAIHVAAQIAAIKGCPLQKVLKFARKNTQAMYGI